MITIICDRDRMEYDIHSLVKAFYPDREVKVLTSEQWKQNSPSWNGNSKASELDSKPAKQEKLPSESNLLFYLVFSGDQMKLELVSEPFQQQEQRFHGKVLGEQEDVNGKYGKSDWKLFLYDTLSAFTGKELPWGNLTGIRPTKIAMNILEDGGSRQDAVDFLIKEHRVSLQKAELGTGIAMRERAILSSLTKDGYSLYIGIPFCPSTCMYCSFTSYPIALWNKRIDEYLQALEKEMICVKSCFHDKEPDTIYIGGGTPTSLDSIRLEQLLADISRHFDVAGLTEFTVEAGRADSITREKLRVLKKYQVSRISVNPQTMNDETLKLIGRRHTSAQVQEAFQMAREEGFDNINMDMILGLPGETDEMVQKTVDAITKMNPESLTVHSLAVKRASKMGAFLEQNGYQMIHNTEDTMQIAEVVAMSMDMKPYYLYRQKNMAGNLENVGYAKDGKYGIYNILIMEEKQSIAAIGAGSISKVILPDGRIERCDNVKDVADYLNRTEEMLDRKKNLFALLDKIE